MGIVNQSTTAADPIVQQPVAQISLSQKCPFIG